MTSRYRPDDADRSGDALAGCKDDLTASQSSSTSLPLLARTIEGEIIPRLMMTLSVMPNALEQEPDSSGFRADNDEMIGDLIQLLLNHDAAVSVEFLNVLREQGARLRDLYLDLLAPAARQLGRMWEEDTANFAQVTIATSRLQQILLEYSPVFCSDSTETATNVNTAAIFALPGESHTFGISMVVEFFRRAGWNVYTGSLRNDSESNHFVSTHDIDLLGISVSHEDHLEHLPERIAALRAASRNPNMRVLCGGPVFSCNPNLAHEVGADGFAKDGSEAVDLAESLVNAK